MAGGASIGRLFMEIGGDTSRLNSALKQAMDAAKEAGVQITRSGQSVIASFDAQLNPAKRLEEQLKLLEVAGKKQADIARVMGEQIRRATDATIANGQAVPDVVKKYADLTKQGEKTGFSIDGLGKRLTDFASSPVAAAKAGVNELLAALGPTAVGVGAIGTAAAIAGAAVFKMAADAGSAAEQLVNLSASTGLSLKELQVFNRISEEMGLGAEGVTRAVEKLQEQLGKTEGGDFTNALAAYNIALTDNAGATRPVIELLDEFRLKILAIEDPQRQAQVMAAAFGTRQRELTRLLLSSSSSLAEWEKALKSAGVIQTDEAIKRAAEFDDKLDKLGEKWTWLANIFKEGSVDIALAITNAFSGLFGGESAPFSFAATGALGGPTTRIRSPFDNTARTQEILDRLAKGESGDPNAIARRAEENARLRAMQTGATKELAAAMADLAAAQEKFRGMEKTANLESRKEQTAIIVELQKRVDKLKELETASKRLADERRREADREAAALKAQDEKNLMQLFEAQRADEELMNDLLKKRIDILRDVDKLQTEIDRKGHLSLIGLNDDDVKAGLRRSDQIAKGIIADFEKAEQENKRSHEKMIDSMRQGYGSLFDAMVSRGKGAFTSLSDWLEGAFLTRLRTVFQNLMESIFTPSSGGSWFQKLFKGVFPTTTKPTRMIEGPGGEMGWNIGGVFYPSSTGAGLPKAGSIWSGLGGAAGVAGLGIGTGSVFAARSSNPYLGGAGYFGTGLTGIAGLAAMQGVGSFGANLGSLLAWSGGGPLTLAIGGGIMAGIAGYKLARGKNAWEAGGMEASRDFGFDLSKGSFQQWAEGLGLTESSTYPIRKDLMSSPLFLTQVAGPAAKAQGTMDSFLKSLEAVKTSWGTFNFRNAFELGDVTGDWSELDRVFKDAFQSSAALQKQIPEWEDMLLTGGSAAKEAAADFQTFFEAFRTTGEVTDEFEAFLESSGTLLDAAAAKSSLLADELLQVRAALVHKPTFDGLKALKVALEADVAAADDMYTAFFKTGEITEEFAAKIEELGGELAAFEKGGRLAKLLAEFDELADAFRQTGVVADRLREIFEEFGGDLAALDVGAGMEGLLDSLTSIEDLIDGFERLLDAMSPVQQILRGEWGGDAWGDLIAMGLDPAKLTGITDLIKLTRDWDKAVSDFNRTGKLTRGGTIEQALWMFGGAEGSLAIERYRQGYNTISPALLDRTKSALDKAFNAELKTSLDYLRTVEEKTNQEISDLNDTVEAELKSVRTSIVDALDLSKAAVVTELGKMLDVLREIALNTAPATVPVVTPLTTSSGDGSGGPGELQGAYPEPGGLLSGASASIAYGPSVHVEIHGPVYADDLERRVTDAVDSALLRGWQPVRSMTR